MYRMYFEGPSARTSHAAQRSSAPSDAPGPRGRGASWQAALARLAQNHPLFEHRASLEAIHQAQALPAPAVVSLGLGLCAPRGVSQGVPLDVLAMLLCAEATRVAVGAREAVVLIADAHALASGLPAGEVEAQARRLEEVVARCATACNLTLRLQRASSLHRASDHRSVHQEVLEVAGPATPPYVSLETADTEALRRRHGSLLKLGWSLGGPREGVRDERFFDARYIRWVGARTAFAYVKAGRTLSPSQPRSAPYVVADPGCRPLLAPNDPVREKLAAAEQVLPRDRYRAAVKHYGQVVSAYAARARAIRGPLPARIEALLEHLFAQPWHESAREAAE